jgi:superfamily II RNA helicase
VKTNSAALEVTIKQLFSFELDDFQKTAIAALAAGKSVVVCAPTGSGKTIIGEYAIYRARSQDKRVFYTTPLKALSNQKFRDFQEQFPNQVGLITGDIIINPEAPVIVMTTEIFRNMLYETPIGQVGTSLEGVEAVILDECHYLNDRARGTVWEESIIYCPPQIQLVALSATIGNPEELTDWINYVRTVDRKKKNSQQLDRRCELINSDFRPVPLQFHFSTKSGIIPLLNNNQTAINPHLKAKNKKGAPKQRIKRSECPTIADIIAQLRDRDMLPAIYIIFSRRGCDEAAERLQDFYLLNEGEARTLHNYLLEFFLRDSPGLQQALLAFCLQESPALQSKLIDWIADNPDAQTELYEYLQQYPEEKYLLWNFLATTSHIARIEQIEPLTRGIATHHAGLLPGWKELVEQLFEIGLVKVVFATATLAAGINMPARTTVISALSKRTDDGHSMLTPSEFLQIAGRAGRRGKDIVGHVVTLQSPFEGAKEAAYLATAQPDPLRSWFTPSYGMVLNLLQKHTLEEAKDLLEKSFAEYLAQIKLAPEQQAIAELTTELARLDVELASIDWSHFASYEKLRERLREENRLFETLQLQAEASRKKEIAPLFPELGEGNILYLKGKHVQVVQPLTAILVNKIQGSGQAYDLVCLAQDNRWYVVSNADVTDIDREFISTSELAQLTLPDFENYKLGRGRKGDEQTAKLSDSLASYQSSIKQIPEIIEQAEKVVLVQTLLENHPLQQRENPAGLIKRHKHRLALREKLHKCQIKYQKQKSNQSYYWDDFLNLIKVLQEFQALEGFHPTKLGQAAATIRSDNELWLALALMSGELDSLEPQHLAAALCALITETPRSDSWCEYPPPEEVLEALGIKKRKSEKGMQTSVLREIRPHLFQTQHRYGLSMPIWREYELVGLSEQWALGVEWNELCQNTNLDEGDLVRMLRRTVDVLWQIPQIPNISMVLERNARSAIAAMKRFPI